ncbi:hypothetical protein BDB00DRAFT_858705 [Zychaea mexicana]|uniref:uncharacterized protein n=1 Tax=Zychaea mexicana TaxID=64656 RepID=UPI0022FED4D8|nr:uncharacterized protein BDB00DRAFT_858705 [Zychaea mexicana]KAI9479528.1 hypothetical protein BDB00DRAFT_858705 [Zychaea mexicana]
MTFTLVGGHDKKIPLEQQYHPCPRCDRPTVQLTRSETQFVIFNQKIGKSTNMRVRYECQICGWKNENLPDNPNDRSYSSWEDETDNNHDSDNSNKNTTTTGAAGN